MRILLNGAWRELRVPAPNDAPIAAPDGAPTLATLLQTCGYGGAIVATAVNGQFIPSPARGQTALRDGDRVEVLAPMQGG